jgi:Cytochrome c biogenesis factor
LTPPWIVLGVGALAVMIFVLNRSKSARGGGVKNFAFVLFFVSVLFLIFNFFAKPVVSRAYENLGAAFKIQAVNEIALRQSAAVDVAVSVLKQSPQNFLIGSGPGTFAYGYIKFKPAAANQDSTGWNLVFGAPSEMINRTATLGVLGFLILLAMIIAWAIEGFCALAKEGDEDIFLPLAVFSGWLAAAAAMFYYPFNLTLSLVFWFLLAAAMMLDEKKKVVLHLDNLKKNYAMSLIFAGVLLMMLALTVQGAKHYYAETEYLGAMKAFAQKDIAGAIKKLEAAADATDRLQDNHLVSLSQAYLALAEEEIGKSQTQDAAAVQAIAPYLEGAVRSAMQSTENANPNSSTNWAMRAYIYRKLIGVSEGFDAWALDMYQNAIKLEPTNPLLFNEMGQIYVIKNDLGRAKIAFEKAVEMMPQYIDARYYLALIADRQGNKAEAVKQLEAVLALLPADDAASRENVAKAIENLKQGGSIDGQKNPPAAQPQNSNPAPEPGAETSGAENNLSPDLEKVLREGKNLSPVPGAPENQTGSGE